MVFIDKVSFKSDSLFGFSKQREVLYDYHKEPQKK